VNKGKIITSLVICGSLFLVNPAFAVTDNPSSASLPQSLRFDRLSGDTRYETAKAISEYYANGKVQNLILATGNEFADALSASVLAHEKRAPILLVDTSVERSKEAFDYVRQHLDLKGTVYVIGGPGIIGTEFEAQLTALGFNKIVRIAGLDRYDTSYQIACSLPEINTSTVVISSGEQYPDALSISSVAAKKGWPILLSPLDKLPLEIKNFLLEKKPSKVYITGGKGAISETLEAEVNRLVPQANIERLTGESRFDTNVKIAETFAPNPSTVYLATGYGFADAMAGSIVAAQNGDPIIFIDSSVPTLPKSVATYFRKLYENKSTPNLVSFGGRGVVTEEIIKSSLDLLSGTARDTSIYSVADITAEVRQNEVYSLPATVQAKLYNSDSMALPVKWNPTLVDTSKVGSSVYEGTAEGYSNKVKLNLTVKEPLPFAQYTTYFDANQVNRTVNIRLATKALDGKRLAPGEQFSFNKSVGERTAEAGYKEALIIEGDVFTPGLGGGICQVSSTLYNAAVLANLEIVERHHHTLPISYVPPGQDATVAYPTLDFKFKNTTGATLLIRSSVEGGTLTFKLYKEAKK
jgi:putative cell wall-binding protein